MLSNSGERTRLVCTFRALAETSFSEYVHFEKFATAERVIARARRALFPEGKGYQLPFFSSARISFFSSALTR